MPGWYADCFYTGASLDEGIDPLAPIEPAPRRESSMMILWLVLYFIALVCCCALVGATRVMSPERVRVEHSGPRRLDRRLQTERIARSASRVANG